MVYKTFGTCSREINFDVVDNKITNLSFLGGCNGNLQGISRLVVGMNARDAIEKMEGIRCGFRPTSYPISCQKH